MRAGLELPRIPERIVLEPVLSNEEFEQLCAANSDLRLERTQEGVILVNAPAGSASSGGNAEITYQLRAWWKTHRLGMVFDSSVGVFLPDGSALGPDSAYATEEQIRSLRAEDLDHFLPFVPAFVIELRSKTDGLKETDRKMRRWVENGAQLAWMVDPYNHLVSIYGPASDPTVEVGNRVIGSGPVQGFVLELADVWGSFRL